MNIKNFLLSVSVGVAVTALLFSFQGLKSLHSPTLSNVEVLKVESASSPSPTPQQSTLTDPQLKQIKSLNLSKGDVVNLAGPIMDAHIAVEISNKSKTQKALYLLINSPGGSVLAGEQIISAMEASSVPVYTICLGICASMAAIISQYGKERYGVDRSVLMFHDAAGGAQGYLPHMTSLINMINRKIEKMDSYISNRAGIPLEQFKADQSKNIWIDAEDAVNKHLLDSLVTLNLDVVQDEVSIMDQHKKLFYLNN